MSNSNLHQRRPYTYSTVNNSTNSSNHNNNKRFNSTMNDHDTISSSTLLKSNPTHHQKVYKLKIPFLYKVTPNCLNFVTTILSFLINCLCLHNYIRLKPYWEERYLILVGEYLYKFQPLKSYNHNDMKMKMKGCPIPIDSISLSSMKQVSGLYVMVTDDNNTPDYTIPVQSNCNGYFSITSSFSSSKTTYYATESQLDSHTWMHIIHNSKQECIKKKMGHSKHVPIDMKVEYANVLGKRVVERKQRIRDLIRKKEVEEVELMCFYGNAHNPRGYFG